MYKRQIVGVIYHPVGVHVVEVVLEIRQKQGVHAHRVDEHILRALDIEAVSYTHLFFYHNMCFFPSEAFPVIQALYIGTGLNNT